MLILTLILLVGVNAVPFILPGFYIWLAQGLWVQGTLGIMLSFSFFLRPKFVQKMNIPLGLLHLWVMLVTLYFCYQSQSKGMYEMKKFLPYFNFLCIILLYKFITEYLTKENIILIMKYLRYTVIATLFMTVLQILNIAQFYKLLTNHHTHNNIVTGFIGNGTHLSGFLASCIPLFLWKCKREDWLCLILMLIVLCFCGTTIGDPAISGFIIFALIWLFYFKKNYVVLFSTIICFGCISYYAIPYLPSNFLGFNGRVSAWKPFWEIFKHYPITGTGLGSVAITSAKMGKPEFQHMHMEYFHYGYELGLIGLALIINLINNFVRDKAETKEQLVLKSMVVGFLLSSCFNYPSHLWLPVTWVIFAYSGFQVLKRR